MDTLKIAICDDDLLFGNQARDEVKKILEKNYLEHSISMVQAGGDFRDKTRRVQRKDEFGEITDALASMRTNLRVLIEKIRSAANQLAASSEEFSEKEARDGNFIKSFADYFE